MLLIATIIGLAAAGDVHRVAGARYDNPQAGLNNQLTLYLSLDSGLRAGGALVLDLSALPATSVTTCKLYPLLDSLDASTFLTTNLVVATTGMPSVTGTSYTCTWTTALAANTAYALVIDDTSGQAEGVWGPVGV